VKITITVEDVGTAEGGRDTLTVSTGKIFDGNPAFDSGIILLEGLCLLRHAAEKFGNPFDQKYANPSSVEKVRFIVNELKRITK
jgi:hypothetical protein